jgi:molybdopterin synthase sulfur carrier subunit
MPSVVFTAHLRRLAPAPFVAVGGANVREALDEVFTANPVLRDYVLDDQRRLRRHIALFVDGRRARLEDGVAPGAEIHVLQALSGG